METTTTMPWKKEFEKVASDLQTARDQMRVELHLASMDAKDSWKKIEKELSGLPASIEDATEASVAAMRRGLAKADAFRKAHF